jgi:hypothetical protein
MSNRYVAKPVYHSKRGMHRWMVIDTSSMIVVRFTKTRDEALRFAADRNSVHDDRERERLMIANYVSEGLGE